MKVGLSQIVETLLEAGMRLPITIVIDELDRCRPTYAIKVLEELKHLFDVPGVAFVLGMHGQQLAHSVTAAYGAGFDSQAYLRRFFSRRYALREVALTPLVEKLCRELSIPMDRLKAPTIAARDNMRKGFVEHPPKLIAEYMKAYGLAARDAFTILEMMQTAMALTGDGPILLPLILPMIIAHVRDQDVDNMNTVASPRWVFVFYDNTGTEMSISELSIGDTYKEMNTAAGMPIRQLGNMLNQGSASPVTEMVAQIRFDQQTTSYPHDPARYGEILQKVARFVPA
jgi:hypothetical protein